MNVAHQVEPRGDAVTRARSAFVERFVPVSLRGLARMVAADGDVFCFRAIEAPAGSLELDGTSERYSAMTAIGLVRQMQLGTDVGIDVEPFVERLAAWATSAPDLGDAGLVLWLHALRRDARAEALARRIVERAGELDGRRAPWPSMERGFLLIGLAEALRAGVDVAGLRDLAERTARDLRRNQDPGTGLFSFARPAWRKNLHRARLDARLGSFASQVYPTMGFAALARATGDSGALDVARRCAARLCELQGDAGQWWWIYHVRRPRIALRYPVYSVHQDAMGPMALLAVELADPDVRFADAVAKSLAWFDDRPECAGAELVDAARGVVWRAVQHDRPETTGRLGLSDRELRRMGRNAWLGGADARPLAPGAVCNECRPYHLGWVLLAHAMLEERLARR